MFAFLLAAAIAADVADLGDDSYARREWAELRLKRWGAVAWPQLLPARTSDSAEVRDRVGRLLAPRRLALREARAYEVLTGPFPPDPVRFWFDEQLRCDVHDLAVRMGLPADMAVRIHPRHYARWDVVAAWLGCWSPHLMCLNAVEECRRHIGFADPGWPLRRP